MKYHLSRLVVLLIAGAHSKVKALDSVLNEAIEAAAESLKSRCADE